MSSITSLMNACDITPRDILRLDNYQLKVFMNSVAMTLDCNTVEDFLNLCKYLVTTKKVDKVTNEIQKLYTKARSISVTEIQPIPTLDDIFGLFF